jgi:hypothetical protein
MLSNEQKSETTAQLVKRLVENYERRKAAGKISKINVKKTA